MTEPERSAPEPPGLWFEPLTPASFLDRAAAGHGDRVAVIDGDLRWTYTGLRERARRLAGALAPLAGGRPVAVLAPTTHVLLEANFSGCPGPTCTPSCAAAPVAE